MGEAWLSDTRASYDIDASGYAEKVRGLLGESPYLRASLALFVELVHGSRGGPVADIGCGPGYVTGRLHDAGLDVIGIDLSPEMIAIARRDYPHLRFEVGTMTDLDLADSSVAGIVAFWSIIHVPDHAMPGVFEQFRRVCDHGVRSWSASTSVTRHDTVPRATRVVQFTSIVTIVSRARSWVGFATRDSPLKPSWSSARRRYPRRRHHCAQPHLTALPGTDPCWQDVRKPCGRRDHCAARACLSAARASGVRQGRTGQSLPLCPWSPGHRARHCLDQCRRRLSRPTRKE